jgi:hypothetical protein
MKEFDVRADNFRSGFQPLCLWVILFMGLCPMLGYIAPLALKAISLLTHRLESPALSPKDNNMDLFGAVRSRNLSKTVRAAARRPTSQNRDMGHPILGVPVRCGPPARLTFRARYPFDRLS